MTLRDVRSEDVIFRKKLRLGLVLAVAYTLMYYIYFTSIVYGGVKGGIAVYLSLAIILLGMFFVWLYHVLCKKIEREVRV